MDYGEVLTRAWRIIWKYKVLWIFGIFAGLASQISNGVNSSNGVQYRFDWSDLDNGQVPYFLRQYAYQAEHFFDELAPWFWVVLVASLFILAVALWLLSIYGRAGLVRGTVDGDEDQALTFGGLFNKASHYFGRLLLFDLLMLGGSILVTVLIILALGVFGIITLGVGLLCLAPLLCLLIPLLWVLGIYLTQVQVALVAEDLNVWDAFARAWKVVTGRLGEMVVMGLILFVVGLAVGLLLTVPFGLTVAPFFASFLATGEITATALTASVVIGLVLLPFAILAGGILQAYMFSAWTLTYRRLTGHPAGVPAVVTPAEPVPPIAPEETTPQA